MVAPNGQRITMQGAISELQRIEHWLSEARVPTVREGTRERIQRLSKALQQDQQLKRDVQATEAAQAAMLDATLKSLTASIQEELESVLVELVAAAELDGYVETSNTNLGPLALGRQVLNPLREVNLFVSSSEGKLLRQLQVLVCSDWVLEVQVGVGTAPLPSRPPKERLLCVLPLIVTPMANAVKERSLIGEHRLVSLTQQPDRWTPNLRRSRVPGTRNEQTESLKVKTADFKVSEWPTAQPAVSEVVHEAVDRLIELLTRQRG
jgi:hypothetical protein